METYLFPFFAKCNQTTTFTSQDIVMGRTPFVASLHFLDFNKSFVNQLQSQIPANIIQISQSKGNFFVGSEGSGTAFGVDLIGHVIHPFVLGTISLSMYYVYYFFNDSSIDKIKFFHNQTKLF